MFNYELFRVNLILKRKSLSMTQEELAEAADTSEKNLSKIESGKQCPNLSTIISILNVFNTTIANFMENEDTSEKETLINKIEAYLYELSDSEKEFVLEMIQDFRKGVDYED